MADRIEAKQITVPAGTLISAPQVSDLAILPGRVIGFEIIVPPGPSGLAGFQIMHSNQRIIPFGDDNWIIADDEKIEWPLNRSLVGDYWQFRAYNIDIYEHTFYVRMLIDEIARLLPGPSPLLDIAPGGDSELEDELPTDDLIGEEG